MKKLQNDFTTPEQSKRLLELGVPELTADCILCHYNGADDNLNESNWELPCVVWSATEIDRFIDDEYDKVLPCWSVGRLIEIMKVCSIPVTTWYIKSDSKKPLLEYFMDDLESALMDRDIDFSKLEE